MNQPYSLLDEAPILRMARRLTRFMPESLIDQGDLVQSGWIGVLNVPIEQYTSAEQYYTMCYLAAWREMIDTIRRFTQTRWRHVCTDHVENMRQHSSYSEEARDTLLDIEHFVQRASLRDRVILRAFAQGIPGDEIGKSLGLTEGRISQIRSALRTQWHYESTP